METSNVLSQYGITEKEEPDSIENCEFQDELASFIKAQFTRAQDHRRAIGIDQRLIRNLYAKKCEYTPEQAALVDQDANVYVGLCALKARAMESWLTDIVLSNIDKPWTINATPIPSLPDEAKERVLDLLVMEIGEVTSIQDIKDRAKELKEVALDQAKEYAETAVEKMEQLIADQLAEGSFTEVFNLLIQDLSTYPTVFIRGPFEISRPVAKWDGDTYSVQEKSVPDVRIISPFDAYPSPTSTTTQNGEFFCERARLLPSALYDLINTKGFDEVNIRRALEQYDAGYKLDVATDSARDNLENKDQGQLTKSATVDTIIYNGLVPGKWLIEKGVLVKDPQKQYEAEVYVCGDYVIRAVLNPNLLRKRPINSTSCVKVNRSIWGQCIIDLVYDTERICNASARSTVKNMAYASGPMVEADGSRLEGQDPTELYPYKVFLVGPDLTGSNAPAIRFNSVTSVLPDLMALLDRYMKLADDLSGIPAYVLGNPQVAGAGRTMGGLSMLMGNAAKGIKNIQLNVDREMIAPTIEGFYVYNMQTSKDRSIKADAQVVAHGATGLLQRELSQARLVEVLQILLPLIPQWDNLPDGVKVILREVLKQTGLPVDDIMKDPQARENLISQARALGQKEAFDRGTSSPVPLPPQSQPPANVNPQPMPLSNAGPA